jgi:hypothetical protein
MKKNIFSIFFSAGFLLSFLTACNLPSATEPATTDQSSPEALLLASPTTQVFPTIAPTSVLPSPTPYIPTLPALTPVPLPPNSPIIPIQFEPGGTWKDIQGSVPADGSKTYTFNARQNQTTAISVYGGYFPLQIQGRDGRVLCPSVENTDCYFWRGTLPSWQDYYIILKSGNDQTQYTLRVAILPGTQPLSFQYQNPATGLSIKYPDTFAPAIAVQANYKTEPELSLHFIDSQTYDNTNLSEVYFLLSSTSDSQVVKTCTEPNQNGGGPEVIVGNEGINGYTFVHSTSEGAGAGNLYQQEIYRMVNNNVCYEVIYFIHSANIGNYTPGTVIEFDRNAVLQQLYGVFSTFTIK